MPLYRNLDDFNDTDRSGLSVRELESSVIKAFVSELPSDNSDLDFISNAGINITSTENIILQEANVGSGGLAVEGSFTLTNKITFGSNNLSGNVSGDIVSDSDSLILKGAEIGGVSTNNNVVMQNLLRVSSSVVSDIAKGIRVEGPGGSGTLAKFFLQAGKVLPSRVRESAIVSAESGMDVNLNTSKQLRLNALDGSLRFAAGSDIRVKPFSVGGNDVNAFLTIEKDSNTGSAILKSTTGTTGSASALGYKLMFGMASEPKYLIGVKSTAAAVNEVEVSSINVDASNTAPDLSLGSVSKNVKFITDNANNKFFFFDAAEKSFGTSSNLPLAKFAPHDIMHNSLTIGTSGSDANMVINTDANDLVLASKGHVVTGSVPEQFKSTIFFNDYAFDSDGKIAYTNDIKLNPSQQDGLFLEVKKSGSDITLNSALNDLYLSSGSGRVDFLNGESTGLVFINPATLRHSQALAMKGRNSDNALRVTNPSASRLTLTTSSGGLHVLPNQNVVMYKKDAGDAFFAHSTINQSSIITPSNLTLGKFGANKLSINTLEISTTDQNLSVTSFSNPSSQIFERVVFGSSMNVTNIEDGVYNAHRLSDASNILLSSGAKEVTLSQTESDVVIHSSSGNLTFEPSVSTDGNNTAVVHGLLNIVSNEAGGNDSISSTGNIHFASASGRTTLYTNTADITGSTLLTPDGSMRELQLKSLGSQRVKSLSDVLLDTATIRTVNDTDVQLIPNNAATNKVKLGLNANTQIELTPSKISSKDNLYLTGFRSTKALHVTNSSTLHVSTTGGQLHIESVSNVINITNSPDPSTTTFSSVKLNRTGAVKKLHTDNLGTGLVVSKSIPLTGQPALAFDKDSGIVFADGQLNTTSSTMQVNLSQTTKLAFQTVSIATNKISSADPSKYLELYAKITSVPKLQVSDFSLEHLQLTSGHNIKIQSQSGKSITLKTRPTGTGKAIIYVSSSDVDACRVHSTQNIVLHPHASSSLAVMTLTDADDANSGTLYDSTITSSTTSDLHFSANSNVVQFGADMHWKNSAANTGAYAFQLYGAASKLGFYNTRFQDFTVTSSTKLETILNAMTLAATGAGTSTSIALKNNLHAQNSQLKNTTGLMRLESSSNVVDVDGLRVSRGTGDNAMYVFPTNGAYSLQVLNTAKTQGVYVSEATGVSVISSVNANSDLVLKASSGVVKIIPKTTLLTPNVSVLNTTVPSVNGIFNTSSDLRVNAATANNFVKVYGTLKANSITTHVSSMYLNAPVISVESDLQAGMSGPFYIQKTTGGNTGYYYPLYITPSGAGADYTTYHIQGVTFYKPNGVGRVAEATEPVGQGYTLYGITATLNSIATTNVNDLSIQDKTVKVSSTPSMTTHYEVTVVSTANGNKYVVTPPIEIMVEGHTYVFHQNDQSNRTPVAHPIAIAKTPIGVHPHTAATTQSRYPVNFSLPVPTFVGDAVDHAVVFTPNFTGSVEFYCLAHSGMGSLIGQVSVLSTGTYDHQASESGFEVKGNLTTGSLAGYNSTTSIDKSLKFVNAEGVDGAGAQGLDGSSYWEVAGGNVVLTRKIPATQHADASVVVDRDVKWVIGVDKSENLTISRFDQTSDAALFRPMNDGSESAIEYTITATSTLLTNPVGLNVTTQISVSSPPTNGTANFYLGIFEQTNDITSGNYDGASLATTSSGIPDWVVKNTLSFPGSASAQNTYIADSELSPQLPLTGTQGLADSDIVSGKSYVVVVIAQVDSNDLYFVRTANVTVNHPVMNMTMVSSAATHTNVLTFTTPQSLTITADVFPTIDSVAVTKDNLSLTVFNASASSNQSVALIASNTSVTDATSGTALALGYKRVVVTLDDTAVAALKPDLSHGFNNTLLSMQKNATTVTSTFTPSTQIFVDKEAPIPTFSTINDSETSISVQVTAFTTAAAGESTAGFYKVYIQDLSTSTTVWDGNTDNLAVFGITAYDGIARNTTTLQTFFFPGLATSQEYKAYVVSTDSFGNSKAFPGLQTLVAGGSSPVVTNQNAVIGALGTNISGVMSTCKVSDLDNPDTFEVFLAVVDGDSHSYLYNSPSTTSINVLTGMTDAEIAQSIADNDTFKQRATPLDYTGGQMDLVDSLDSHVLPLIVGHSSKTLTISNVQPNAILGKTVHVFHVVKDSTGRVGFSRTTAKGEHPIQISPTDFAVSTVKSGAPSADPQAGDGQQLKFDVYASAGVTASMITASLSSHSTSDSSIIVTEKAGTTLTNADGALLQAFTLTLTVDNGLTPTSGPLTGTVGVSYAVGAGAGLQVVKEIPISTGQDAEFIPAVIDLVAPIGVTCAFVFNEANTQATIVISGDQANSIISTITAARFENPVLTSVVLTATPSDGFSGTPVVTNISLVPAYDQEDPRFSDALLSPKTGIIMTLDGATDYDFTYTATDTCGNVKVGSLNVSQVTGNFSIEGSFGSFQTMISSDSALEDEFVEAYTTIIAGAAGVDESSVTITSFEAGSIKANYVIAVVGDFAVVQAKAEKARKTLGNAERTKQYLRQDKKGKKGLLKLAIVQEKSKAYVGSAGIFKDDSGEELIAGVTQLQADAAEAADQEIVVAIPETFVRPATIQVSAPSAAKTSDIGRATVTYTPVITTAPNVAYSALLSHATSGGMAYQAGRLDGELSFTEVLAYDKDGVLVPSPVVSSPFVAADTAPIFDLNMETTKILGEDLGSTLNRMVDFAAFKVQNTDTAKDVAFARVLMPTSGNQWTAQTKSDGSSYASGNLFNGEFVSGSGKIIKAVEYDARLNSTYLSAVSGVSRDQAHKPLKAKTMFSVIDSSVSDDFYRNKLPADFILPAGSIPEAEKRPDYAELTRTNTGPTPYNLNTGDGEYSGANPQINPQSALVETEIHTNGGSSYPFRQGHVLGVNELGTLLVTNAACASSSYEPGEALGVASTDFIVQSQASSEGTTRRMVMGAGDSEVFLVPGMYKCQFKIDDDEYDDVFEIDDFEVKVPGYIHRYTQKYAGDNGETKIVFEMRDSKTGTLHKFSSHDIINDGILMNRDPAYLNFELYGASTVKVIDTPVFRIILSGSRLASDALGTNLAAFDGKSRHSSDDLIASKPARIGDSQGNTIIDTFGGTGFMKLTTHELHFKHYHDAQLSATGKYVTGLGNIGEVVKQGAALVLQNIGSDGAQLSTPQNALAIYDIDRTDKMMIGCLTNTKLYQSGTLRSAYSDKSVGFGSSGSLDFAGIRAINSQSDKFTVALLSERNCNVNQNLAHDDLLLSRDELGQKSALKFALFSLGNKSGKVFSVPFTMWRESLVPSVVSTATRDSDSFGSTFYADFALSKATESSVALIDALPPGVSAADVAYYAPLVKTVGDTSKWVKSTTVTVPKFWKATFCVKQSMESDSADKYIQISDQNDFKHVFDTPAAGVGYEMSYQYYVFSQDTDITAEYVQRVATRVNIGVAGEWGGWHFNYVSTDAEGNDVYQSSKIGTLAYITADHNIKYDRATGNWVAGGSKAYEFERDGDALKMYLPASDMPSGYSGRVYLGDLIDPYTSHGTVVTLILTPPEEKHNPLQRHVCFDVCDYDDGTRLAVNMGMGKIGLYSLDSLFAVASTSEFITYEPSIEISHSKGMRTRCIKMINNSAGFADVKGTMLASYEDTQNITMLTFDPAITSDGVDVIATETTLPFESYQSEFGGGRLTNTSYAGISRNGATSIITDKRPHGALPPALRGRLNIDAATGLLKDTSGNAGLMQDGTARVMVNVLLHNKEKQYVNTFLRGNLKSEFDNASKILKPASQTNAAVCNVALSCKGDVVAYSGHNPHSLEGDTNPDPGIFMQYMERHNMRNIPSKDSLGYGSVRPKESNVFYALKPGYGSGSYKDAGYGAFTKVGDGRTWDVTLIGGGGGNGYYKGGYGGITRGSVTLEKDVVYLIITGHGGDRAMSHAIEKDSPTDPFDTPNGGVFGFPGVPGEGDVHIPLSTYSGYGGGVSMLINYTNVLSGGILHDNIIMAAGGGGGAGYHDTLGVRALAGAHPKNLDGNAYTSDVPFTSFTSSRTGLAESGYYTTNKQDQQMAGLAGEDGTYPGAGGGGGYTGGYGSPNAISASGTKELGGKGGTGYCHPTLVSRPEILSASSDRYGDYYYGKPGRDGYVMVEERDSAVSRDTPPVSVSDIPGLALGAGEGTDFLLDSYFSDANYSVQAEAFYAKGPNGHSLTTTEENSWQTYFDSNPSTQVYMSKDDTWLWFKWGGDQTGVEVTTIEYTFEANYVFASDSSWVAKKGTYTDSPSATNVVLLSSDGIKHTYKLTYNVGIPMDGKSFWALDTTEHEDKADLEIKPISIIGTYPSVLTYSATIANPAIGDDKLSVSIAGSTINIENTGGHETPIPITVTVTDINGNFSTTTFAVEADFLPPFSGATYEFKGAEEQFDFVPGKTTYTFTLNGAVPFAQNAYTNSWRGYAQYGGRGGVTQATVVLPSSGYTHFIIKVGGKNGWPDAGSPSRCPGGGSSSVWAVRTDGTREPILFAGGGGGSGAKEFQTGGSGGGFTGGDGVGGGLVPNSSCGGGGTSNSGGNGRSGGANGTYNQGGNGHDVGWNEFPGGGGGGGFYGGGGGGWNGQRPSNDEPSGFGSGGGGSGFIGRYLDGGLWVAHQSISTVTDGLVDGLTNFTYYGASMTQGGYSELTAKAGRDGQIQVT